jgi:hypothetical protein
VLYETHSVIPAENSEMVTRLVEEMNKNARQKHAEERVKAIMACKQEESETSGASGFETVAAPTGSALSSRNIDGKDPERPSFSETDITVSCASSCQ